MEKYAGTACPPNPGDRWRVNFSRVEWEFERYKGGYLKKEGVPCDNWVWSPMGVINMHEPHMWGIRAILRHHRRRGGGRILGDAGGPASTGSAVATWTSRPLLSGGEEPFILCAATVATRFHRRTTSPLPLVRTHSAHISSVRPSQRYPQH